MPTRGELLDSRGWYPSVPREDLPGPAPAGATYAVVFVDRATRGYARPRPVELDCEPAVWVALERDGAGGWTQRTWRREYGAAGVVYREQTPAAYTPTAYQPGRGVNRGTRRSKREPEPEDEWA